jgi:hypothetical protein
MGELEVKKGILARFISGAGGGLKAFWSGGLSLSHPVNGG